MFFRHEWRRYERAFLGWRRSSVVARVPGTKPESKTKTKIKNHNQKPQSKTKIKNQNQKPNSKT